MSEQRPADEHVEPSEQKQPHEGEAEALDSETEGEDTIASEATEESAGITELERKLTILAHELAQEKEKGLRIAADAENVKRRATLEAEKARNFAIEKFAGELLSVIDNLERALQSIDKNDAAQATIAEGIEMTHKSFLSTIEKFGMEVIDPQGQPFNPQHHEAMGMQEHAELPPNTVLYVMQKGYLLNGRLLRPAMVMVTRAAATE
ncbi:nucleotide exchange factor GrpE [Aliidiomarina sanyensis]|uniref:Protein GrpE n=1 Tax=Aliidiomarina sanyensis TaxID=1249555 RepID=A0A432WDQ4_9GAMM|nr:nucleotide exchange factor GrpE [Aliidiomarina sanyensis]RUO30534.1 nucleotide exchange factor GrpE [Aliidiomarina sanyensis]